MHTFQSLHKCCHISIRSIDRAFITWARFPNNIFSYFFFANLIRFFVYVFFLNFFSAFWYHEGAILDTLSTFYPLFVGSLKFIQSVRRVTISLVYTLGWNIWRLKSDFLFAIIFITSVCCKRDAPFCLLRRALCFKLRTTGLMIFGIGYNKCSPRNVLASIIDWLFWLRDAKKVAVITIWLQSKVLCRLQNSHDSTALIL